MGRTLNWSLTLDDWEENSASKEHTDCPNKSKHS